VPAKPLRVMIESSPRKVFAIALDWPGWARSARDEDGAVASLLDYLPRYAEVADQAGVRFARTVDSADVVARLDGDASTQFGVPGRPAPGDDSAPLTRAEAERLTKLVVASWEVFDRVRATTPETLTKGPRGGGRDRDPMVDHVLGAEAAYARKIGVKIPQPAADDAATIASARGAIADTLRAARRPVPDRERGWPYRYAARRIAWHVLDHAWEMQDRSSPSA
jgi:hypothetical protein